MSVFGLTRSVVARDHALLAPESFVPSLLAGWERTQGVVLISPRLGARFTQSLVFLEPQSAARPAPPGTECVLYVLSGEAALQEGDRQTRLGAGGYVYLPPDHPRAIWTETAARLVVFERTYLPRPDVPMPGMVIGQEQEVTGAPFQGDPDAVLKTLLPDNPAFDMAVNLFTFQPGAALPQVEVHVMEHGLVVLAGAGVYRLGDAWYPVQEGDVIWMAPYCPQWFTAMGKTPARYLYYKDINRDPQETPA
jgi:(S)-ureidoglycine aminohydrolase